MRYATRFNSYRSTRPVTCLKLFAACAVIALLCASQLPSLLRPAAAQAPPPGGDSADSTIHRAYRHTHVDAPHLLAASYYSLNDNLSATLMLSNQGPHSMQAQVSLFSLSGERLDLAPVTLDANTARAINLNEYALAGTLFQEGSLQVRYDGMDLELGGVIKLVDAGRSLIFDEELSEPAKMFASSQLEGVWWPAVAACRSAARFVEHHRRAAVGHRKHGRQPHEAAGTGDVDACAA